MRVTAATHTNVQSPGLMDRILAFLNRFIRSMKQVEKEATDKVVV